MSGGWFGFRGEWDASHIHHSHRADAIRGVLGDCDRGEGEGRRPGDVMCVWKEVDIWRTCATWFM